jgi:hypothetical protein
LIALANALNLNPGAILDHLFPPPAPAAPDAQPSVKAAEKEAAENGQHPGEGKKKKKNKGKKKAKGKEEPKFGAGGDGD